METLEINGWKIYFHSCFLDQLTGLSNKVESLKRSSPEEYMKKAPAKLLAAIIKVVEEVIPSNPLERNYRQGDTLGADYRHWFRVKFLQQFRLFFRCSEQSKTIVIGWVNDFDTLRAYGSKTDAYRVFAAKLEAGAPPDDWATLLSEAKESTAKAAPGSIPGFL